MPPANTAAAARRSPWTKPCHGATAPVQLRRDRIVGVRIRFDEAELREVARRAGATWDREAKLWRMTYRAATSLNLRGLIVET